MASLISLCQNAALLALGVLAYAYARPRLERWPAAVQTAFSGALFAALTLLSMLAPLAVVPGVVLDARNTLVALATVFAGPIAGAMAALPAALYRLGQGGTGAVGALYGLAASALLGWAWRAWAARKGRPVGPFALALLGSAISLALVASLYVAYDPVPRAVVLETVMLPYALSIILGLPALGMLVLIGDRQRGLQRAIERRDETGRRAQDAVVRILQGELLAERDLENQLRAITRIAAETLGVDVVTVWSYDETRPVARCLERWDGRAPILGHVPRGSVPDTHYDRLPDVRAALTRNLSHRAVDARTDPVAGPLINEAYPGPEPASMLYSGIRHANRLVGHVAIGTVGRTRNWTLEEERFARSLADLVGLALLQGELDQKEATLRRNRDLLIHLVRDVLLRRASIDEILSAIVETVSETLSIERTSIWHFDPTAQALDCLALWDNRQHRHIPSGLTGDAVSPEFVVALRRDSVLVIDDTVNDARLTPDHRKYLQSVPIQSMLFAHVGLPGDAFGVLVFAAMSGHRAWTLEEQAVARSLADLVGLALLRDEIDQRERALRRNQALVIQLVRDELLRVAPLVDVLRSMTETIGRTLDIDRTSVWKLDLHANVMRCVARWHNLHQQHAVDGAADLTAWGPLYEQLRREIVVEVEDLRNDARVAPTAPMELGLPRPRSTLIALIGSPDQPIGALSFANERAHAWTLEDHALIRSLSQMIGFAFISQSYREAIAALDLVSEGICVQGPTAEIIYANRSARALGLVGDSAPELEQALGADGGSAELSWVVPGGARRELAVRRSPLPEGGSVTMLSDVTEANARQRAHDQLEEQLRQTTKMEAVGRLAGGIAHDFNNMIGAILGFATFLAEDLEPGSAQQAFAQRITEVCTRSREVVKQLLTFSRPGDVDRRVIDLRSALTENAALLRASLPSAVRLSIQPGAEALPVLVNAAQIYQVLLNLCGNAKDAIEGAGSIAIEVDLVGFDHRDRRVFEGVDRAADTAIAVGGRLERDQRYAVMRVTDSGAGMDQDTLDRVFEPFFSTKPRGRGTGLGLAVVHGIVTAYQGAYLVQSRIGTGSAFALYLPLATAETRGGESVLIVDDDVDVADMLSIALERLGFDVTCSYDPHEALEAFAQDPGAWDIVISDQVMPGLKGLELIEHIKASRPDCITVLCTGFDDAVSEAHARDAGADLFFLKPADTRIIAERIRTLLDRRVAALA